MRFQNKNPETEKPKRMTNEVSNATRSKFHRGEAAASRPKSDTRKLRQENGKGLGKRKKEKEKKEPSPDLLHERTPWRTD